MIEQHELVVAGMRYCLSNDMGCELIFHLLEMSEVMAPQSPLSGEVANYKLGKRALGLEIFNLMNEANPLAYANMYRSGTSDEEDNND